MSRRRDRRLAKLESIARQIGDLLRRAVPKGVGFAVFIFDFGGPGEWLTYLSNAKREDMINVIEEWLEKERRTPGGTMTNPN